ncbi:MAG: hypothetical protein KDA38_07140 [Planctomycetales bacterium]|nr:hypothetical protein [Planctomycetales bacterium]
MNDYEPATKQPRASIGVIIAVLLVLMLLAVFACGGVAALFFLASARVPQAMPTPTINAIPTPQPYASPGVNRLSMARNLIRQSQYQEAIMELDVGLTEATDINTRHGLLNQYAWLLATCPHDQIRDGERAVTLAEEACSLSGYRQSAYVDTLAAAHAEAGDFAKAIQWQEQALSLAGPNADQGFRDRLARYENRTPYREGPNFQALPADPVPEPNADTRENELEPKKADTEPPTDKPTESNTEAEAETEPVSEPDENTST